jgi:transposase
MEEKVFVGLDWAEDHHDVCLLDAAGRRLGKARLADGLDGVIRLHEMIGEHADDPGEVVLAAETDRGLFVGAMIAAGYRVLAINPMSTARYRERQSTSGAKSDAGDAFVLAEVARTDRHLHRPVAGDSDLVEALKIVARAHQSLIWTRQRQTNQLRSMLREFFPAALQLGELHGPDALGVLTVASTPERARTLSVSKIGSAIRRAGRQRRIEERAGEIQAVLRSDQLAAPPVVANAMGVAVAALVPVITAMNAQIAVLEAELADRLTSTRTPRSSVPCQDWGRSWAPGCWESSGTTRTAMPMPSLARTTPPRHPSPRRPASRGSCSPATPGTSGWPTPSTCGPSQPSKPAPAPASSTTNAEPAATPTTEP